MSKLLIFAALALYLLRSLLRRRGFTHGDAALPPSLARSGGKAAKMRRNAYGKAELFRK